MANIYGQGPQSPAPVSTLSSKPRKTYNRPKSETKGTAIAQGVVTVTKMTTKGRKILLL